MDNAFITHIDDDGRSTRAALAKMAFVVTLVVAGIASAQAQSAPMGPVEDPNSGNEEEPTIEQELASLRKDSAWHAIGIPSCVSIGSDGSVIESWDPETQRWNAIPVGGGRSLECKTFQRQRQKSYAWATSDGALWCGLENLQSYSVIAPDTLSAEVSYSAADDLFVIKATAIGEPLQLAPTERFGGLTWGLSVEAFYSTTAIEPARPGATCDQQFGL